MVISQWLVVAAGILLALVTGDADAAVRFVASNGNDANPCSRTAPCQTLQRAHDVAAAGDEIQILDSGDYLVNLFITKSITVSAIGVSASIEAISVDDPTPATPTIKVVLRGLHLHGQNTGFSGLFLNEADSVEVDRCNVQNYSGPYGIRIDAVNEVSIRDCVVSDNAEIGISILGTASVLIERSRIENNGTDGIVVGSPGNATIVDTIISGNGENGIEAQGSVQVVRSISANNGFNGFAGGEPLLIEFSEARGNALAGLTTGANGDALISNSVFTNNTTGVIDSASGSVLTRENNTIAGNGTNVTGTLTPLAAQ
jgi:parallel beta-helix repeat protein